MDQPPHDSAPSVSQRFPAEGQLAGNKSFYIARAMPFFSFGCHTLVVVLGCGCSYLLFAFLTGRLRSVLKPAPFTKSVKSAAPEFWEWVVCLDGYCTLVVAGPL